MKILLTIDGGGIRGLVPAAILDYLEKRIQEFQGDKKIRIGKLVDLVAGTSTGSIVGSLSILPCDKDPKTPKYTMEEIINLYIGMGPQVFKEHFWHNVKTLWGLIGPKFPASNIENPLLQIEGFTKMKDLVKPCLFTGYDIDRRRVNIYTNADEGKKYGEYYLKDIIRGSTAIPAYFPPAYFRDGIDIHTIVDGGVFANNPSMVTYIEASKTWFDGKKPKDLSPKDLLVISLGTGAGKRKRYDYNKAKRFGKIQWVLPIIDVLLSGSSDVVDYEMDKLFKAYKKPENYLRINPPLHYSTAPSTDASKENIENLLKDVKTYIENNQDFLDELARRIMQLNNLHLFKE
jgi:uncharacterized protein